MVNEGKRNLLAHQFEWEDLMSSKWLGSPKKYTRGIVVYSRSGEYLSAAIAAAVSSGRPNFDDETNWSRPEKVRSRYGKELTRKQHVLPEKSIARLADERGFVGLYDIVRGLSRRARPNDHIFCARRAWDQRAEAGYMKQIESTFQELAELLISDGGGSVEGVKKRIIDEFFALWYVRSRYNQLERQETILEGVVGDDLTLEEEEKLESEHYLYVRRGGRIPTRLLNGIWIQQDVDKLIEQWERTVSWRVIESIDGEYITPDVPTKMVIPLRPRLALMGNVNINSIAARELAKLNSQAIAGSRVYYFAKNFGECPCEI